MKHLFILLLFAAVPALLEAQVTNGLVAKYSFDNGNANADVGTLNGLVTNATLDADRFGNANKSYRFSGPGSGGHILLADSILSLNSDFTITHWFYVDSIGSEFQYTLQSRQDTTGSEQGGLDFMIEDTSRMSLTFRRASPFVDIMNLRAPIRVQQWTMISIKRAGQIVSVKANDVLVATDTLPLNESFQTPLIWSMGSIYRPFPPLIARELSGNVDDVQFFNRALSDTEETSVYNAANPTLSILSAPAQATLGRLFPNPVNTRLQLQLNKNTTARVHIFNSLGQLIQEEILNDLLTELDFSSFSAGLYTVVIFQDGKRQVGQVLKQ